MCTIGLVKCTYKGESFGCASIVTCESRTGMKMSIMLLPSAWAVFCNGALHMLDRHGRVYRGLTTPQHVPTQPVFEYCSAQMTDSPVKADWGGTDR